MISYITGRSGSGKTAKLYSMIRRSLSDGAASFLIVPEQFTFETERALMSSMPRRGCMHVDVCSFERLVFRVLAETGGLARTFLSRPGKDMLIRSVMDDLTLSDLSSFGRVAQRVGFATLCGEWIALFKRSGITPEMLGQTAPEVGDDALGAKLHDLSRIFFEVERRLGERYLDLEDMLRLFLERAPQSKLLAGAHVYVDGFDQLARQDYLMLEAIMCAADLTVTLRLPQSGDGDAHIFEPERMVFDTLSEIASRNGIPETVLHADMPSRREAALRALERNLFAKKPARVPCDGSVRLYECATPSDEVDALAKGICALVREGYRYRDIAVLIPDFTLYSPHIARSFSEHAIPCFFDAKRPLLSHSISDFLLAATACASGGFKTHDVQRVLKSGYALSCGDMAEKLSLFLQRAGIRDATRPIEFGDESGMLENARRQLIEPLLCFRDMLKSAKTATACAEALYRYLESVGLAAKLLEIAERLNEQKRYDLARQNAQVWDILMQTLDQIAGIFGDDMLSPERFLSLLEEGVRMRTVGVIPTTADQVLVGDIARTISRRMKAVMVLGCNEGLLPRRHMGDELISAAECEKLTELGLPGWPNSDKAQACERMDIYSAFSRATRQLRLYYSLANGGEPLVRSSIVDRVLRVFPGLEPSAPEQGYFTPRASFGPMIRALRDMCDDGRPCSMEALYKWYSSKEPWDELLGRSNAALFARGGMETLPGGLSKRLFASGYTTASRIEAFARCPFQHFARYGLAPNTRVDFTPRAPDAGSFVHLALDALTRAVKAREIEFSSLDAQSVAALLDELWDSLLEQFQGGLLQHDARGLLLSRKLKRMVGECFLAVASHMAAGDFEVIGSELKIGEDIRHLELKLHGGEIVRLSGIIDRADRDIRTGALRVVDYKTGETALSLSELYYGDKPQLPLYMLSLALAYPGSKPAGMFYVYADAPPVKPGEDRAKLYRMNGLVLDDEGVLLSMDRDDTSSVVNARIKKTGGLTGAALGEDAFNKALAHAQRRAQDSLSRALAGDVRARPLKRGKRTACAYCDFKALCGFDEQIGGFTPVSPPAMSLQEFVEALEGIEGDGR